MFFSSKLKKKVICWNLQNTFQVYLTIAVDDFFKYMIFRYKVVTQDVWYYLGWLLVYNSIFIVNFVYV